MLWADYAKKTQAGFLNGEESLGLAQVSEIKDDSLVRIYNAGQIAQQGH
jgi:hypothetical protein